MLFTEDSTEVTETTQNKLRSKHTTTVMLCSCTQNLQMCEVKHTETTQMQWEQHKNTTGMQEYGRNSTRTQQEYNKRMKNNKRLNIEWLAWLHQYNLLL